MTVQDELRGMDLFEELSDERLDAWAAVIGIRDVADGDVRARSIKRVASAVGEGSMAVSLIHEYLAE